MWWLIGVPFIAWGVYSVVNSIIAVNKDPSVGAAAMIVIIAGGAAIVIGSLLSLLAWMLT